MEETNKIDKTKEQVKEVTANKDTKNDIPNQVAGADNETIDKKRSWAEPSDTASSAA